MEREKKEIRKKVRKEAANGSVVRPRSERKIEFPEKSKLFGQKRELRCSTADELDERPC